MVRADISMQLGEVTQTLEVQATATLLQTETEKRQLESGALDRTTARQREGSAPYPYHKKYAVAVGVHEMEWPLTEAWKRRRRFAKGPSARLLLPGCVPPSPPTYAFIHGSLSTRAQSGHQLL
jgi:hypothetical protein